MKRIICHLFLWLTGIPLLAREDTDSIIKKITGYATAIHTFCKYIPQEKVYLHFDNTSYYQGDHIWFKCYLVDSRLRQTPQLSKTLYVELLNPGGEIIGKKILKIQDGQCHGEFTLDRVPFYSGFYEVRAYTKYMLNFGEEAIFSRLLPVFDKPATEGDFAEKKMQKYGISKYPLKRKKPDKAKRINLKFFPEGGNLVAGVPSQVAFEATDAYGNPLNVSGTVINEHKEEVTAFSVIHEGKGVFSYTPSGNDSKAVIEYNDRTYKFDLPEALPTGFVMNIDNVSDPDSIAVTVSKNSHTPDDTLGLVIFGAERVLAHSLVMVEGNEETVQFKLNKTKFPAGVSRAVLFDRNGNIISDRLIFTGKPKRLNIHAQAEKTDYMPHELVNITFQVSGAAGNPSATPFSVSIKDGTNQVESGHNILTNLLLMSEIKGYVRNPSYYFESEDYTHRSALDLLLMVQGWRRYAWKQITGAETFELKYRQEQGLETQGQVVSMVRSKPKPGVDVSYLLTNRNENDKRSTYTGIFVTDSLGRFYMTSHVTGKWNMILSVAEKGKRKNHRIILDRVFSPTPRRYRYAEMQVDVANEPGETETEDTAEEAPEEDYNQFLQAYRDSLIRTGNKEKVIHLDEVTIKARKNTRESDIYNSRIKSLVYYDVHSEIDDIKDRGKHIGNDIHQLLINLNPNIVRAPYRVGDYLYYKGRLPLFVINYEPTKHTELEYNKYKSLNLAAIKSIYISEDFGTLSRYADPDISRLDLNKLYGCTVLIETYPEDQAPAEGGKGVRKTWLEGYSQVKEFYGPDYSSLPPEPDYRRTLYWNPLVTPDNTGKATINFYNNSSCRKFKISAETISSEGAIGVYREEY